jgi:hypothetical protein
MKAAIRRLYLAAAFVLFFMLMAGAQGIRVVKGKITDEKNGKPIGQSQVVVQAMDGVLNLSTKTNAKGEYTLLLGERGGLFRIIVLAQGYQFQWRENIRPEAGGIKEENFNLVAGIDNPPSFIQRLIQRYQNPALQQLQQQFLEKYLKNIKEPERLHIPEYLRDLS